MPVTVTGLTEMKANVERLPDAVTAKLKEVARGSADRICDGYAVRLTAQTNGTGATAASAHVVEDTDQKQFSIKVPGNPDRPPMLPNWLEYGTRYMDARPALRPAAAHESRAYKANMVKAAEDVVTDLLK